MATVEVWVEDEMKPSDKACSEGSPPPIEKSRKETSLDIQFRGGAIGRLQKHSLSRMSAGRLAHACSLPSELCLVGQPGSPDQCADLDVFTAASKNSSGKTRPSSGGAAPSTSPFRSSSAAPEGTVSATNASDRSPRNSQPRFTNAFASKISRPSPTSDVVYQSSPGGHSPRLPGAGGIPIPTTVTHFEATTSNENNDTLSRRASSRNSFGAKSRLSDSVSDSGDICRICHCEGDEDCPLMSPCLCAGSMKYVHQSCLQQWVQSSDAKCCELCKFLFIMTTKTKPLIEWRRLDMSPVERRKLMCSVTFHIIAITCVVWSLYVLIERTTNEVQSGALEWPFWTKLIVVAVGFTGGLVFMYVQCKMYVVLLRKWRAFNRKVYIQECPSDSSIREQRQFEPEDKV